MLLIVLFGAVQALFRSSRPDYIETASRISTSHDLRSLFRSSRPDYIETKLGRWRGLLLGWPNCSGLPDRTTLRRQYPATPLRPLAGLFRSSRPDYIETSCLEISSAV